MLSSRGMNFTNLFSLNLLAKTIIIEGVPEGGGSPVGTARVAIEQNESMGTNKLNSHREF